MAIGRNVPLPELVAWFASFEADVVIEFVVPEDAMVKQLLRNRDELDFGYTQPRSSVTPSGCTTVRRSKL